MFGYHNKLARVNLTTGRVTYEELPNDVTRSSLAGRDPAIT